MTNDLQIQNAEDEIDLKELFSTLWAYKFFIAVVSLFFLVASAFYASRIERVYVAQSIFSLGEADQSASLLGSLGGQLGPLSALAGLPSGGGGVATLVERVNSRGFILEVVDDLDLQDDQVFNSYKPDDADPAWKAAIKSLLGMGNAEIDGENAQIWDIVETYQELIVISATDAGALEVSVTHRVPERAARIANFLASKIIAMENQENLDSIDRKLQYLSQTLADALQDLETAQNALKQYSLANSTQAVESFAVGSVLLDDMRAQRKKSADDLAAIAALKAILAEGSPTLEDYEQLREAFPEVDQAGFRRILGLSEVTSAWSWPSINTVLQVEASIQDRLASIDREIQELSDEAKRYASSAEELAQLTRNLKIAEAAYTVLIEQVKTQSLVAGFQPEDSRILAAADVPITPSAPKVTLILALGLVLGLFSGAALALIFGSRRGVYFTLSALLEAVGANYAHRVRKLNRFKRKGLAEVQQQTVKARLNWPRQIVLELENQGGTQPVILCDISSGNRGEVLGRIIAATAGSLGRNAAFVDLSRTSQQSDKALTLEIGNELGRIGTADGCSEYVYVSGNKNIDMMYSKNFKNILSELLRKYDLLIFSANEAETDTVLASSFVEEPLVIASVSSKKTKISAIKNLLKRSVVGIAIYE